jgi:hypothetical protein
VTGVDIDEPETREKLPNEGKHLVGHVLALGTAHEQRGLLEPDFARIFEGEVAQIVERAAEDVERHAELLRLLALRTVKVAEEKLSDRERL